MVSGRAAVVSPPTRFLNPSRTPSTSIPWLIASIVTELITPLMPGAGPPPTTIASLPREDSAMRTHLAEEPDGPEGGTDERPGHTLRIGTGGGISRERAMR